jgi:NADH:ubiquinone oxidoreductase subunit E
MRQCGKGPNLKWDGQIYNRADPELLKKLLENG